MRRLYINYSGLYYFAFFSLGAVMIFITEYLLNKGLNGIQVGTITAAGSFVAIFSRPVWGILCDKTQEYKKILYSIMICCTIISFCFIFISNYYLIIIAYIGLYFFQSGITPIIDSIALYSDIGYGSVRLWGAIGFAVGAFITGIIAENLGLYIIFIIYSISYIIALLFIKRIEVPKCTIIVRSHFEGINTLIKNNKYILFLICAFFVHGTITAHNTYFCVLYKEVGGSETGIGLAFLLFAGSEAPFMKYCDYLIKKISVEKLLVIAILISIFRWYWYSTAPNPKAILILFMLQGVSIGIYLVAAVYYIKEITIDKVRTTALAVYSSLGAGMSTMVCNYIGGVVFEKYGVQKIYLMFSLLNIIGLLLLLLLISRNHKKKFYLARNIRLLHIILKELI